VTFEVRLQGRGRAEVAAAGVADAEHRVESDLARCWPDAHLQVREIRRSGEEPRIAEEFIVEFRLLASLAVEAADADSARSEAFRQARDRLRGSRFWGVSWEESRLDDRSGGA
jgi:hypothetical protein